MGLIDNKKIAEAFCIRHGIVPTSNEKIIIRLAILEGITYQIKRDITDLKKIGDK